MLVPVTHHAVPRRWHCALGIALAAGMGVLSPGVAPAAEAEPQVSAWTVVTRAVSAGSSDEAESDPQGYKVYSAFTLEAAVRRRLARRVALELTLRTESREVDRFTGAPEATRLGSVELLPVSLLLQYRRPAGSLRPYLGLGANLTVCWEKSGALDSSELSPSLAPAVQLGLDAGASQRAFFNVDVRWNPMRTNLTSDGVRVARLKVDGLALGLGVGLRF